MKKTVALVSLFLVAVIWGGGFVAIDIALNDLTPFQIMSSRFLISAIFIFIINAKYILKAKLNDFIPGIILGMFLFVSFAFQTIGLQYTTPSKNAFLTSVYVVFVPFLALIFSKKKLVANNLIGAFLTIIGVGVLSLEPGFTMNIGDILTLISTLGFAAQIYLTNVYVKKANPMVLNFTQMVVAFVLSVIAMFATGQQNISFTRNSFIAVLYLGIVSTGISFLVLTTSQRHVSETQAAIILSLESVFGSLFSILLLGEKVTPRMIVGCLIILVAVIISNIASKPTEDVIESVTPSFN